MCHRTGVVCYDGKDIREKYIMRQVVIDLIARARLNDPEERPQEIKRNCTMQLPRYHMLEKEMLRIEILNKNMWEPYCVLSSFHVEPGRLQLRFQ